MARVRSWRVVTAAAVVVVLGAGGAVAAVELGGSGTPVPPRAQGSPSAVASAPAGARTTDTSGNSTVSDGADPVAVRVPAVHRVLPPDAVVTFRHAVPQSAIDRLRRRSGIRRATVLDTGDVTLPTGRLHVAAVRLAGIRGFTPKLTAQSRRLWESIARGELTVGYAASDRKLRHRLGDTVVARGRHGARTTLRIGAFATLDIEHAQAVVSSQRSADLGLKPRREVMIAAPKISLDQLSADIRKTLGRPKQLSLTRPEPFDQSVISTYATTVIPTSYLDLYRRAAVSCPGLPWTVLAGIGTVETGNGRDVHQSVKGAEGPMQFLPSTWAMYGVDADGDGKADIDDPTDAVFSAARYLCAAGAGLGGKAIDNAIFSYNHAWWYVREVLVLANQYA